MNPIPLMIMVLGGLFGYLIDMGNGAIWGVTITLTISIIVTIFNRNN